MQHYETLVRRWFDDLFTHGRLDTLEEFVASDFTTYDAAGKIGASDLDRFRKWFRWYRQRFSGAEWTLHDVIVNGDRAVVRYSGLVSYAGGWEGIPPVDRKVTEMGILIFRFREDRISELWSALGDFELMLELGARPVVYDSSLAAA